MRLTKSTVEAAQPGTTDRFFWDDRLPGFGVKVTPKGRRTYVVQYRPRGRTQTKRITLGPHGTLWTTERARESAQALLLRVQNGEDPIQTERAARAAADLASVKAAEERFDVVLDQFIERYAKPKNRRWQETHRVIAYDAVPAWRDRPVNSITRRDVLELIDDVGKRSPSSARALYAQLRRMFGWCVERQLLANSPCNGMRGPPPVKSRDRWLNDYEVSLLWKALEILGGPFEPLFKLLLLTGQRREEVTGMRWQEVDLERAEWVIAKERCKNGSAHAVDLAPLAVEILSSVPRSNALVFTTTGATPLSNHSKYRQRLLATMQALATEEAFERGEPPASIAPWTVHDLRRTAATGMASLGTPPHVVEAVLNHRSGARGGLVAVYQHYQHRAERRAALLSWADHVCGLRMLEDCSRPAPRDEA
jgi:integrase